MKTKRPIRLPIKTIERLQDLRDSYAEPRSLGSLVNAALRQTANTVVPEQNIKGITSVVQVFLSPQFEALDHSEIVSRVVYAVDLAAPGIIRNVVALNRIQEREA